MSIDVFVDVLQSKLCHELNAFPTVRGIIARELVKSQIERAHVLDLSTINSNRARHATIADHLIELGSRDTDIHCRLVVGETATGDRPKL